MTLPAVTDKTQLHADRVRMGLGTILYQSEETGIGPIPTVIVRLLGGDDRHLGILGALGGLSGMGAVFSNNFLKWRQSNRGAMVASMVAGAVLASLIGFLLLLGYRPGLRPVILDIYLPLLLLFALISGVQLGIETSWIGDLVPENLRGWFMKIKWVLSIFGILIFSLAFARFSDAYPTFGGYASIYFLFALSFLVAAICIYPRVTDRLPKTLNYFSAGATHHERVDYKEKIFWYTVGWGICWSGGRGILGAFTAIYLLEYFNYSLTKIAALGSIQGVMSMLVVYLIGDHTDRWGARRPLMVAQFIVASSMLLWIASAFWGVKCIIAYMILNGAAGHTLTFLGGNFMLEVYPSRGRAAYLGMQKMFANPVVFLLIVASGWLAHAFNGFQIHTAGHLLNRYHLIFVVGTFVALCSPVFLILIGNRRIRDN